MKICLVTAFPPSHERVNEYGYHLALELQRNPYLSVTVLANEYEGREPEFPGFDVERCWRPDSLANPVRLLKTIREIHPDVVWFNLVFASFGVNPAAAFLGLCTPSLVRAAGFSTHVTLHHLMENIDLEDSGIRFPRLYRRFGWLATHLLLCANSVTVLLPAYRRTLLEKYHRRNVHFRAHGIFSTTPQYPDFSRRGNPARILAFGKWGTYKRVEPLLRVFPEVKRAIPGCKLVIAGENHPLTPGYLESLSAACRDNPDIEVHGYVPEDDIAELFSTASVLVMPYTSATGSSGVAHQACQVGLPIICADLPDFRDMAQAEGLAIEFFRAGDRQSLSSAILRVAGDLERQRAMAEQNYSAAVRMTIPQIVRQYLRSFDWQLGRRGQQPPWRWRPGRAVFAPLVSPAWNTVPVALPLAATAGLANRPELRQPEQAISDAVCSTHPSSAPRIYNIAAEAERAAEEDPPLVA